MAKRTMLRVFATLNLLAGGLAVWGGGQELFYRFGDASVGLAVGACGALAGIILFASGAALLAGRDLGRRLALWGGLSTVVVHAAGIAAGSIGVAGLLYWVAYPAAMMVYMRTNGGTGSTSVLGSKEPNSRGRRNDHLQRVAVRTA